MPREPKSLKPVERPEDRLLCVFEEPGLIDCEYVEAQITDVQRVSYEAYSQKKLVFWFTVVSGEYEGSKLPMYAVHYERPGINSKLYKLIRTAMGGCEIPKKINKKVFLNKVFLCKLRTVESNGTKYTVVDRVEKKLAGH